MGWAFNNPVATIAQMLRGPGCALAGHADFPDCGGVRVDPPEWHHVFPKRYLKKQFPHGAWLTGGGVRPVTRYEVGYAGAGQVPDYFVPPVEFRSLTIILGDKRNRVWLCSDHHEHVERGRIRVVVPQSVWDFVDEYDVRGKFENDLARQR